jgi:UDP-GlcNAc:undecaprenyl-phosphate/decaprenyl-phosphate GlcNAc-1-phosphate transferase
MLTNSLIMVLIGVLLSMSLVSLLKKFSVKCNALMPKGVPLIGGVAMGLSFSFTSIFGLFIYRSLSPQALGVILASLIMLIFGLVDDLRELSVVPKFLVQLLAASVLIYFGVRTQIVHVGNMVNVIITLLWVIGITNAINHLDVMDGLAAGTSLIAALSLFIISILSRDINAAILTLSIAAAAFGFLLYNFPPAKVYMGNSGSHFLGFILAAVALLISYAPLERKVALLSPLLILGFPIFDTAFLILVRTIKRCSPFKKSNDHPALKFLALGYSKKKALLVMLCLCLFFSLCGILLSRSSNLMGLVLIASVIFVSLSLTKRMLKVEA